jgi:hypothetical protein
MVPPVDSYESGGGAAGSSRYSVYLVVTGEKGGLGTPYFVASGCVLDMKWAGSRLLELAYQPECYITKFVNLWCSSESIANARHADVELVLVRLPEQP